MTRRPRDVDAERRDLAAATERLLAGTPLRSTSGRLTSTELITESGLRRDVVYGDHKDLVDDFQARVKAQHATPDSITRIADENRALKDQNNALKNQLSEEHETTKTLAKIIGELSLELHQARDELTTLQQIPHIGAHSSAQRARARARQDSP
jgi:cell division septum initiation protein DivIVA